MKRPITDLQFRELAAKCQEGTATTEEKELFNEAYALLLKRQPFWDKSKMGDRDTVGKEIYQNLYKHVKRNRKQKMVKLITRYVSAAVVVVSLSFAFYFIFHKSNSAKETLEFTAIPGTDKAILTLADGETIDLTEIESGTSLNQGNIQVTKTAEGQLLYKINETKPGRERMAVTYNTISTPRGGQYQVVLSDGTKVWLNASSSIKFPSSFEDTEQRLVEMTGEAYFEVAKNKRLQFIVRSADQDVTVLGTHFNINNYKDDGAVRTSLLEGSVKVKSSTIKNEGEQVETILKVGEQSVLTNQGIKVIKKDIAQIVDWKNGDFIFQKESIEDIMRRVARWYNIQVVYTDGVDKSLTFSGHMSRSKELTDILNNLSSTGEISFKIEGATVKVLNRN